MHLGEEPNVGVFGRDRSRLHPIAPDESSQLVPAQTNRRSTLTARTTESAAMASGDR